MLGDSYAAIPPLLTTAADIRHHKDARHSAKPTDDALGTNLENCCYFSWRVERACWWGCCWCGRFHRRIVSVQSGRARLEELHPPKSSAFSRRTTTPTTAIVSDQPPTQPYSRQIGTTKRGCRVTGHKIAP